LGAPAGRREEKTRRVGLPPEASAFARLKSCIVRAAAGTTLPESVLVARGSTGSPHGLKRVAITFDDGPDEMTPQYLEMLDRLGVRCTFFLIGKNAEMLPSMVNEVVAAGHEVAGHGFSHRSFTSLSVQELVDELIHTSDALPPSPGARPLVRPPYGQLNLASLVRVAIAGYTTVLWSFDSDDCRTYNPKDVEARLDPANVRSGEIVLMHEGQAWTLAALPAIVGRLREAGYELVTVGDLLSS
jgi:peptidoglycan/xylan/chitin deacetylase (PgdA/CDA1 family)